jgi:hypothetical protein
MKAPKGCTVSSDGGSITLSLPGKRHKRHELVLTFDEASSLAMTLPRLLRMALRQKYSDGAVRHVYPLREYAVEFASDLRHLIVTLATDGGFDVVFAINVEAATAMARDLARNGELLVEARPVLPH